MPAKSALGRVWRLKRHREKCQPKPLAASQNHARRTRCGRSDPIRGYTEHGFNSLPGMRQRGFRQSGPLHWLRCASRRGHSACFTTRPNNRDLQSEKRHVHRHQGTARPAMLTGCLGPALEGGRRRGDCRNGGWTTRTGDPAPAITGGWRLRAASGCGCTLPMAARCRAGGFVRGGCVIAVHMWTSIEII